MFPMKRRNIRNPTSSIRTYAKPTRGIELRECHSGHRIAGHQPAKTGVYALMNPGADVASKYWGGDTNERLHEASASNALAESTIRAPRDG